MAEVRFNFEPQEPMQDIVRRYIKREIREEVSVMDRLVHNSSNSTDTGNIQYYGNFYDTRGQIGGEIDEIEPVEEEDPRLLFDPEELVLND